MTRRTFNSCLNKEQRIYNFSVGSIACAALAFLFVGLAKGIVWGIGAAVGGYVLGDLLSKQWHEGNMQREIYWRIPFAKYYVDKNMPESHHRKTM